MEEYNMCNRFAFAFLMLAGIFHTGIVAAQITMPEARFAEAPQLGELVPDLVLVDDEGNPANLRELTEGHYTVLTLGCLT
jgi:hypothetical protein